MRVTPLAVVTLAVISLVRAQAVIDAGGIVNNASYRKASVPESGIAQGSLFAVFGEKLGPPEVFVAGAWPLQGSLAGTSVEVTGCQTPVVVRTGKLESNKATLAVAGQSGKCAEQ